MELNNLSDGTSDGVVLFYLKEGKLYPVLIKQEQAELLDVFLNVVFEEEGITIHLLPLEYKAIKNMLTN